jgi:hypothetical protein
VSWKAKALVIVGGIFALCALAWMAFLPAVAEHELREITGFNIRMKVVAVDPFTGNVVIRGMTAENPSEYPESDFIELRSMAADVSVFSVLFSDRIVVDNLDANIAKVEIVRLHDGRTNTGQFMAAFRGGGASTAVATASPLHRAPAYLIKKLHVRFDQLVVLDESGSKSDKSTYDLHIDDAFTNVTGPGQLLVPSILRDLHSFGLHHDVSGLLPGEFGNGLAVAVGGAANVGGKIKAAASDAGDYLKGALDKLEQKAKP